MSLSASKKAKPNKSSLSNEAHKMSQQDYIKWYNLHMEALKQFHMLKAGILGTNEPKRCTNS